MKPFCNSKLCFKTEISCQTALVSFQFKKTNVIFTRQSSFYSITVHKLHNNRCVQKKTQDNKPESYKNNNVTGWIKGSRKTVPYPRRASACYCAIQRNGISLRKFPQSFNHYTIFRDAFFALLPYSPTCKRLPSHPR